MKTRALFPVLPLFLVVAACGGDDKAGPGEKEAERPIGVSPTDALGNFSPPAASEGYTRLVAPVIEGIEPGADRQYCQYIYAPLDRDVDILDVQGFQSRASHHAVAYAVTKFEPEGTSGPCGDGDSMAGVYVGGIGGEGGGGISMPAGAAFRLPKGQGILLNAHFVNTTEDTLKGESVLDVKFAEVDPERKIMSLFTNADVKFTLGPNAKGTSKTECVFPKDVSFLMFGNHMHHRGTAVKSDLVRADSGDVEVLRNDTVWTAEDEYRAPFTVWDVEEPFVVKAGDSLRTECNWVNETNSEMRFPTEMCIGIGFFLSDGTSSPTCLNGSWLEGVTPML